MITKKTIDKPSKRMIHSGYYKNQETGEIIDGVKVYQKVYIEPQYENIIERQEFWCYDDGVDEHHFLTEEEAKRFVNGDSSTN